MTFADPVPQFSKDELDQMLVDAQEHSRLLLEIERGVNASKEYLTKVRRSCRVDVVICLADIARGRR